MACEVIFKVQWPPTTKWFLPWENSHISIFSSGHLPYFAQTFFFLKIKIQSVSTVLVSCNLLLRILKKNLWHWTQKGNKNVKFNWSVNLHFKNGIKNNSNITKFKFIKNFKIIIRKGERKNLQQRNPGNVDHFDF